MLDKPIRRVMTSGAALFATPDTPVNEAVSAMVRGKASALLVVEGERLAGIFTEHDVLARVIAAGRDVHTTRLSEVMTRDPVVVGPDEAFGRALARMQQHHVRHLPVVENGAPVGLVSARDALDPDLEEFEVETIRRREYARDPARC